MLETRMMGFILAEIQGNDKGFRENLRKKPPGVLKELTHNDMISQNPAVYLVACFKNQVYSSAVAYALSQELCFTPGYSS